MSRQSPVSANRRARIRRVIETRTGRPLPEIVRELYHEHARTPVEMACLCTRLAGEEVPAALVETWLNEFDLIAGEERWAAMVPELHRLLDKLIADEAERRLSRLFSRKD